MSGENRSAAFDLARLRTAKADEERNAVLERERQLELLRAKLASSTPRFCACGQRLGIRQTGDSCWNCQRRGAMRRHRANRKLTDEQRAAKNAARRAATAAKRAKKVDP